MKFGAKMTMPRWFKKGMAIVKVILYSSDVGSDFWVGIDLIIRCHYKFAAAVFSFILLPGFIKGWFYFPTTVQVEKFTREGKEVGLNRPNELRLLG